MPSAGSNVVYQPPARTKPVRRKRRGITSAVTPVPVIPYLDSSRVHIPTDLQLTRDLFNQDTADDVVPDELDANTLPPSPALSYRKNARKRPAHSPEKRDGTSEFRRSKRFKGGEGSLPSDTDVTSSGVSPILSLPTSRLPPATQSMVSVP